MLKFRPHHFLCTLGFRGKGYTSSFVENFVRLKKNLTDETHIEVVGDSDTICRPCPNRQNQRCTREEKIRSLDDRHASALGIRKGEILSWGSAKRRIRENVSDGVFDQICSGCQWKSLGYCLEAIKKLGTLAVLVAFLGTGALAAEKKAKKRSKAKTKATAAKVAAKPKEPHLDDLFQEISVRKGNKIADKVRRGYDALARKDFKLARKFASVLLKDSVYADFGYALQADTYLGEARLLVTRKNFDQAIKHATPVLGILSRIQVERPDSPIYHSLNERFTEADLVLATIYFGQKKKRSAQVHFERAFERTRVERIPQTISFRHVKEYSMICFIRKKTDRCRSWVNVLARLYPEGSKELKTLQKYNPYVKVKDVKRSFEKRTETYAVVDKDEESIKEAMGIYLSGNSQDAIDEFEDFIERYPKSNFVNQARFFRGQAFEKRRYRQRAFDEYEQILAVSPLSYYGMLASIYLDRPIQGYMNASVPKAEARDDLLLPHEVLKLTRAEDLLAKRALPQAGLILDGLKVRSQYSNPFLIYLAALQLEAGNYLAAFRIAGSLFERKDQSLVSSFGLRVVFPIAYKPLTEAAAKKYEVDETLIISLIKQESAFDATAVSSSGAIGLMQLLPTTALDMNPNVEQAELWNPVQNIDLGTKYLSRLLKKFDGNFALALSGYNAGPTRAARWAKSLKKEHGLLEFIETIPFRETRNYVKGIIRNYHWYSYRINGQRFARLGYFWQNPPNE